MGEESIGMTAKLRNRKGSTDSGTLERTNGSGDTDRHEDETAPAAEVSRLRTKIDATRDELGTYISELDRRRHEALDLKLQIKKHPGVVIGVGVAIAAILTGAVVMVARSRKRETLGRRVQRAASRILPAPPPAPADPSRTLNLLLTAALPIGVALARGYLARGRSRRSEFA